MCHSPLPPTNSQCERRREKRADVRSSRLLSLCRSRIDKWIFEFRRFITTTSPTTTTTNRIIVFEHAYRQTAHNRIVFMICGASEYGLLFFGAYNRSVMSIVSNICHSQHNIVIYSIFRGNLFSFLFVSFRMSNRFHRFMSKTLLHSIVYCDSNSIKS